MNTLLLRLMAPMQSWGIQSNYSVRDTASEPSKSGVIGLLCAAMGRPRTANLEDLAQLRMGVRVDREGSLQRDFQIAQNVLSNDAKGQKSSITSSRYYLADFVFLVGLESEDLSLLRLIEHCLITPTWLIYLGRKAFVPSASVHLPNGLRMGETLEQALQTYGLLYKYPENKKPKLLRLIVETPDGEQLRPDVPISFAERRFSSRRVHQKMIASPEINEEVAKCFFSPD